MLVFPSEITIRNRTSKESDRNKIQTVLHSNQNMFSSSSLDSSDESINSTIEGLLEEQKHWKASLPFNISEPIFMQKGLVPTIPNSFAIRDIFSIVSDPKYNKVRFYLEPKYKVMASVTTDLIETGKDNGSKFHVKKRSQKVELRCFRNRKYQPSVATKSCKLSSLCQDCMINTKRVW